jgi:histone H3/H4
MDSSVLSEEVAEEVEKEEEDEEGENDAASETEATEEGKTVRKENGEKKQKRKKVDLTLPKSSWIMELMEAYDEYRISKIAVAALQNVGKLTGTRICSQASDFAMKVGKKTLQLRDIMSAVKIIIPKDLQPDCLQLAEKAVKRCVENKLKTSETELVFGVGQSKNLVKQCTSLKLGTTGLVALAAITQAVCMTFLKHAIRETDSRRIKTVKMICLERAVSGNASLSALWQPVN